MKILRLDLRAFGPFDGDALDFPDPGPDLHLIHGPNEAGKSSALRALKCLLFGFPNSTNDNHRHKYADLRVGATLRAADGSTLAFLRRKGVNKTLRGSDDATPLPDDALAPYLGATGPERFGSLFVCGLDELEAGGRDLIAGRGDFGATLFGASGMARLPDVRKLLDLEAEGLFKGGAAAKNPRINAALISLEAARKSVRDASLAPAEWEEAERSRKAAQARLVDLDADLARVEAEHRRHERLERALPLLAARREATARLEELGDVPMLSEGFAERRFKAVAEGTTARDAARVAAARIVEIEGELSGIDVPDRLLAEAPAVATLREEWGALRKARDRRPKLLEAAARAEDAALAILGDLAPGRTLLEAGSLRLGKAPKAAIRALAGDFRLIESDLAKARDEARSHALRLADAPAPPCPDARRRLDDFASLIKRVERRGDLEGVRIAAEAEARRLEEEARVALARLPRWSGALGDLAARPVPDEATVAHLEGLLAKAEAAASQAEEAARAVRDELATLDDLAEQARRGRGDPPSEADLARARSARDGAWRSVRRAWLDGPSPAPDPGLADAFEHLVASGDGLADALRREAGRVAEHEAREARRRKLVGRAEALGSTHAEAVEALARALDGWSAPWRAAGIEPGPPLEMRAWLASYRDLLARSEAVRSARRAHASATEAVAAARLELADALGEPASGDGLEALLDRAREAVAKGEVARDLEAAQRKLGETEARRGAWRARWAEAVRPLGLEADAPPEAALDALERLDALFARLEEANKARLDLAEIDREAARYARDVDDLVRRAGRVAGEGSAEAVAEALVAALAEAQVEASRRDGLRSRLEAERARLLEAEATARDRDALLAALALEAGCDDPARLPEVERRADLARKARDEADAAGRSLLALGGGGTVREIALEAEGVDPDTLPARLRTLAERAEALRLERDGENREVGRLQQRLLAMDGGPAAASSDGEARQWLAAIEADVEQYARLRLASAVLRKAVDRYRERHQGPILRRLGDLFASLTAGSFAGVALDDDGPDGRPVLVGVRPGPKGEHLAVEGMSEGTADALYLAVRLATLEAHLDGHEPFPFVVDDVLVNFDDARARAALVALAALSSRTQVFFFTHHEHLVSLAREALPADAWRLHRLPGRSVPASST